MHVLRKTVCISLFSLLILSCKAGVDKDINQDANIPEVKSGEVVSAGIQLEDVLYSHTSEVVIIPSGKTGTIDMKDDSSWNTYYSESADNCYRGVFVKNRKVVLNPFIMGQYEVTTELYNVIMYPDSAVNTNVIQTLGAHYVNFDGQRINPIFPARGLTHFMAVAFCNELTKKVMKSEDCVYFSDLEMTVIYTIDDATENKTPYLNISKKGYRLPTEAEWEYAARGGNPESEEWRNAFGKVTTKDNKKLSSPVTCNQEFGNSWEDEDFVTQDENLATVGWYSGNSSNIKYEVGLKDKNVLNLYDMHGNILEWCWDWFEEQIETGTFNNPSGTPEGTSRVCRGGSYKDNASACSVSYRTSAAPETKRIDLGFRVVRTAQ